MSEEAEKPILDQILDDVFSKLEFDPNYTPDIIIKLKELATTNKFRQKNRIIDAIRPPDGEE